MKPHRVFLTNDWYFLDVPRALQAKIGPVMEQRVPEIVHPLDRSVSMRRLRMHRKGQPVPSLERRVVRTDGRVTPLIARSYPIEGGAIAVLEVLADPYEDLDSAQTLLGLASFCLRSGDIDRAGWCVADAMWLDRSLSWPRLERHFNRVLDRGPLSNIRQAAERRQIVDLAMRLERLE